MKKITKEVTRRAERLKRKIILAGEKGIKVTEKIALKGVSEICNQSKRICNVFIMEQRERVTYYVTLIIERNRIFSIREDFIASNSH